MLRTRKTYLLGSLGLASLLVLAACVTINVYFPAAEAQEAAEEFVEKVLGEEAATDGGGATEPENPQAFVAPERGFDVMYDGENMRVTNHPSANAFFTRDYRKGFELA